MARARKGSSVQKGLKFFIYGHQGTWKSSISLDFAKMKTADGKPLRVLYVDCETGSVDMYLEDLENEGIALDNIYVVYTNVYEEIEYYCNKAINNEEFYELDDEGNETDQIVLDADGQPFIPDAIVVDGITVVADNVQIAALNTAEKRANVRAKAKGLTGEEKQVAVETAGLEFKDHSKIKSKGKTLIRNLITKTDKYVAITGRDKEEKKMAKDNSGNMQLVSTGRRVPESWDFIRYEVYTVLHTFLDEEDGVVKAQVEDKDRTKRFAQNEIIEEPSLLLWQEVINSNVGKSKAVVHEDIKDSIKKDEVMYSKIDDGEAVETQEKVVLNSVGDFQREIDKKIKSLNPQKKKAMLPKVKAAGLNPKYEQVTDLEELKKFYSLLTE
jgi:hypothetical protein